MSAEPGTYAASTQVQDIYFGVDPSLQAVASHSSADLGDGKKGKKRKIDYDEHGNVVPKETRPRALRACDACRKNKSRCELLESGDPTICRRCSGRGAECTWDMPPQQRKPKTDRAANDAASPGTAQMANMLGTYINANNSAANFDTSLLSHFPPGTINIPLGLPSSTSANTAKDNPSTIEELREAIAIEEAEVERLQLLLRYKTARQQAESFKNQLLGMEGIKTPPELAHGSSASRADKERVVESAHVNQHRL